MKDNIKIFGFSKNKRTYYKLKFGQIEETEISSVSGKAVFDFLWIDGSDFETIFTKILSSFAAGGVSEAITVAAPLIDKNSYLTVYIAAFIEYLAAGTDEALSEFTAFMGSDFAAPPKDSAHYMMNFINAMTASIEQKKAEIKFYINDIMKDKNGSLNQRFVNCGKESKLFDFQFDSHFDFESDVIIYPLETMDDVIRFDIMQMLANKIKFKPCKCCGHYFVPGGRTNSEYCDRIMPGETRPCNEFGALKTFDITHKNDDIHKAYITAYRRMDSRQRAKLITKDEFKQFGKIARAERKKCYNGEITLEQFQTWLDDFR